MDRADSVLLATACVPAVGEQAFDDREFDRRETVSCKSHGYSAKSGLDNRDRTRSPPRRAIGAAPGMPPQPSPQACSPGSSRDFVHATANLVTLADRLETLTSRVAANQQVMPTNAPSGGMLHLSPPPSGSSSSFTEVIQVMQRVEVPVSALRLLQNSVRAVRQHIEQLEVMVPVLQAAESALQHHITN